MTNRHKKALMWAKAAAFLLLAAGFLGAVSEPLDSLAHLRPMLMIVIVLCGLATALLGSQRWDMVSATALVAAGVATYPHLPFTGPPDVGTGKLKLIQFNVRIHNDREADAAQWILAEKPDVLMLQEVLDETHPSFRQLAEILPNVVRCKSSGFGEVAVMTRFQVMAQHCAEGDGLAWAQVNRDGAPVTFASVHLHWPWPFRQWEQLDRLHPVFAAMPQPVVLAGDFNATPWSAAVKHVEKEIGSTAIGGFRLSFRPDLFHTGHGWPLLPIDHVLLPEGWRAAAIRLGPDLGSDHRPVVADLVP